MKKLSESFDSFGIPFINEATPKFNLPSMSDVVELLSRRGFEIPAIGGFVMGSVAKGKNRPDSDIDITLVVPDHWRPEGDDFSALNDDILNALADVDFPGPRWDVQVWQESDPRIKKYKKIEMDEDMAPRKKKISYFDMEDLAQEKGYEFILNPLAGHAGQTWKYRIWRTGDRENAKDLSDIESLQAFLTQDPSNQLESIRESAGNVPPDKALIESVDLDLSNSSSAYRWASENVDGVNPEENDAHTNQMYRDRVNDYCYKYRSIMAQATIELYRAVVLADISELRTNEIGTHWSFEKSGAGAYGLNRQQQSHEKEHVLTGTAKTKDIDWEYGFTSFLWYGQDQWECALNPGADVVVTAIDDSKLKQPIKGKA